MSEVYTVQAFMFARSDFPRELYEINEQHDFSKSDNIDNLICLGEGDLYSSDTYFNSFFIAYWNTYASIGKIGLEVVLTGKATIRLLWRNGSDVSFLKEQDITCTSKKLSRHVIWFESPEKIVAEDFAKGRLFIEIVVQKECTIYELQYVTDRPPLREVSLSVGLCTYNREKDLAKTLTELSQLKQRSPEVKDVVLVNHSNSFTNEDLLDGIAALGIEPIEQPNLGGCGGFTRTMYEVLNSKNDCTHHLLMDDDIDLDSIVIDRAIKFLRYAKSDLVVGAQMLESHSPTILHEAGGKLDPFLYVVSKAKYKDMSQPSDIDVFDQVFDVDFNAWWFCIVPIKAIRELGYPPPIFIHGDDIEYGCRLGKNGFQTVSPPSIAVWHESFAAKNSDWIQYYDLRNRLILTALHKEKSGDIDTVYLFGFLLHLLLTHRYRGAHMCFVAIRHYLDGPDKLFLNDSATLHKKILDAGKEILTVEEVRDVDTSQCERMQISERSQATLQVAKEYVRSYFAIFCLSSTNKANKIHNNNTAVPASILNEQYLMMNDLNDEQFLLLKPSRKELFRGTLAAMLISAKYWWKRKKVSKLWKNNIGNYQTDKSWAKLFDLDKK